MVTEKKFSKINIEISNICNLQCHFCPEVKRKKQLMDVELFKKIIPQVKNLTEQVCLHLMGEPLLHPKLADFIQICEDHQVPIFLVSNGQLLKESKFELLLNSSIRQVNFSLHSFFDNFPTKDPSDYLNQIFKFTEVAFIKRPDLYINYRLWNLQDVSHNEQQSVQAKNNLAMLDQIQNYFNFSISDSVNIKRKKNLLIKNKLYLHFDTEFIWPSLEQEVIGDHGTCYGLTNHFGILADGTVVPCCLDKEGTIDLGNAENQPIQSILSSEKAKQILNGFKKFQLKEELCKRCNYIQRFKKNIHEKNKSL